MNKIFPCWFQSKQPVISKKTKIYIKKAEFVHGEYYDYSLINYHSPQNYLEIICPEHGNFKIMACTHLSGRGCKKCNNQNTNFEEMYQYYFPSSKVIPEEIIG